MPAQTAAVATQRAAATPAVAAAEGGAAGRQSEPWPAQELPSPPQARVVASNASQEARAVELAVGEVVVAAGSGARTLP